MWKTTNYLQRPSLPPGLCRTAALLASLSIQPVCAALDPALPPGGNFALENWNITVPTAAEQGPDDRPLTVQPSDLSGPSGYSSPWFYTDADGAMTFWTPVNGLAGGGSPKPRSELREMIDPGNSRLNWQIGATSILEAQLRVAQVPNNGVVIIGQVHGLVFPPLVMVYYQYDFASQTGQVIAKLQTLPTQGTPFNKQVLASGIKLGQAFVYQIRIDAGVASAQINSSPIAEMAINPAWDDDTFYFKAGAYLHSTGDDPDEGARVKFYRLATSHPAAGLAITTKASLPNARVGQPYLSTLQAEGGIGGSTWSLVSGHPPLGLSLSPNGELAGIPDASQTSTVHSFMARVHDANGNNLAKNFAILVQP
jgi:hypothetical protein